MAARSVVKTVLPQARPLTLGKAREAAAGCRNCPLWQRATQTVFGEGPRRAGMMLVGEQPGNDEDLAGEPFVGPAGRLLDEALAAAGVPRESVYVTNAVKHFKWAPKGKRRLHQRPNASEIEACKPWLDMELVLIKPTVLVCLGATAAQALFGRAFRVSQQRGQLVTFDRAPYALATLHPSAVLRMRTPEERKQAFDSLVADLRVAGKALARASKKRSA